MLLTLNEIRYSCPDCDDEIFNIHLNLEGMKIICGNCDREVTSEVGEQIKAKVDKNSGYIEASEFDDLLY